MRMPSKNMFLANQFDDVGGSVTEIMLLFLQLWLLLLVGMR